jgi:hypothetical protein
VPVLSLSKDVRQNTHACWTEAPICLVALRHSDRLLMALVGGSEARSGSPMRMGDEYSLAVAVMGLRLIVTCYCCSCMMWR